MKKIHVGSAILLAILLFSFSYKQAWASVANECNLNGVNDYQSDGLSGCPSGQGVAIAPPTYIGARSDPVTNSVTPIDPVYIQNYSKCRFVENQVASNKSVFVPFNSQNEWEAFIAYTPSFLTVYECSKPYPATAQPLTVTPPNASCTNTVVVPNPNVYAPYYYPSIVHTWPPSPPVETFNCGATTIQTSVTFTGEDSDTYNPSWTPAVTYGPDLILTAQDTTTRGPALQTSITILLGDSVELSWTASPIPPSPAPVSCTESWSASCVEPPVGKAKTSTVTPAQTTTYSVTSTNPPNPPSPTLSSTATVTVYVDQPLSVGLTANPITVPPGSSTTLSWSVADLSDVPVTCTASSTDGSWSGTIVNNENLSSDSGASTVVPKLSSGNVTYTLTCSDTLQNNVSKSATITVQGDGSCGSANNVAVLSAPTTNLCTVTQSPPTVTGGGPWNWTCTGTGGSGTDAHCSAPLLVDGKCGSANGGTFSVAPVTNLCDAGTASPVPTGTGPWNWLCTGNGGGGSDASCSASQSAGTPGQCGSANGNSFVSAPTTNLCNVGLPSSVTGSGPWNWSCSGSGGGSPASCTAFLSSTTGQCGSANNGYFLTAPTTNLCNATQAPPTVSGSGPWSWTCTGNSGSGSDASCGANLIIDGLCGSSNNGSFSVAPTTNLCVSTQTPPTVSGSGPWTWTCTGNDGGGSNAICSASVAGLDGACGAANAGYTASVPTTNLCVSTQTPPTVTGSGQPWSWICTGNSGPASDANCNSYMIVDGICGSAAGTAVFTAPTTNLCIATQTAPTVSGSGPWTWTCTGNDGGGSNAVCTAPAGSAGVCGSANNVATLTAPTGSSLCSYTSTPPTVSGGPVVGAQPLPWTWTCTGSDPSFNASCGAPANAQCSISGSYNTANGGANTINAPITIKNSCNVGIPDPASETDPTYPYTSQSSTSTWTCLGSAATASIAAGQSADCTFYNYILVHGTLQCGDPPGAMNYYNAYCCGQPDAGGGGISIVSGCAVACGGMSACGPGVAQGVQTPSCIAYGGAGNCSAGLPLPLPPVWP
jgi:hypothetical protein